MAPIGDKVLWNVCPTVSQPGGVEEHSEGSGNQLHETQGQPRGPEGKGSLIAGVKRFNGLQDGSECQPLCQLKGSEGKLKEFGSQHEGSEG